MQRALWAAAERFCSTFPSAEFDAPAFGRTVGRTKRAGGDAVLQVSSLLFGLLADPPVHDLLAAFVHDQVVAAFASLGSVDPESDTTTFLAQLLADTPAAGLKVVIAAARGNADVAELHRLDRVIADLHPALEDAGAMPLGPLEHPAADGDRGPSNQWKGHLRADCAPHVEHDVLIVLAGRSVGVGEAVSIARRMRIPVLVAALTDTGPPPCRLQPDDDLVHPTITDVDDQELPAAIVEKVVAVAATARLEQRRRVQRMIGSSSYRAYLASQPKSASLSPAAHSRMTDPFLYANSSDHEIAQLASELDAFDEGDLRMHGALQERARAAYDGVALALPRAERLQLLRRGSESIVSQASDPRDRRWHDWDRTGTWVRMLEKIRQSS